MAGKGILVTDVAIVVEPKAAETSDSGPNDGTDAENEKQKVEDIQSVPTVDNNEGLANYKTAETASETATETED